MKRCVAVSRGQEVGLIGSLLLLATVLAVRYQWTVGGDNSTAELAALRAERDVLPVPDPAELALWRSRRATLVAQSWTDAGLATLQTQLGAGWQWIDSAEHGNERRYKVCAAEPAGLAWPELLGALTRLEDAAGVTVESVAVTTAGTRTVRSFARVEIHLTLRWAGPGPTVAPVSPNPDRRYRGRPKAGVAPETAAGARARPAAPRSAIHFAARARLTGDFVPGSARWRGRPDHPRLVRVAGFIPRRDQLQPTS